MIDGYYWHKPDDSKVDTQQTKIEAMQAQQLMEAQDEWTVVKVKDGIVYSFDDVCIDDDRWTVEELGGKFVIIPGPHPAISDTRDVDVEDDGYRDINHPLSVVLYPSK